MTASRSPADADPPRPGREAILAGQVPTGLEFRTLDLRDESQPFALPPGVRAFGLDLSRSAVTALPADLQVSFRIDLTGCAQLTSLPRGLRTGSLVLTGCTGLRALPEDLSVHFLVLDGCSGLVHWPDSARVEIGSVRARNCVRLAGLPSTLGHLTNLDLRGCRQLAALPPGLRLSGWLDVADTQLTSLPDGLRGVELRWRGVKINAQIAFFPETLTATQVLTERNAEVRRVMLERIGLERFLADAQARVLDEDSDPGGPRQLLRVALAGEEDLVCVSLRCPSTGRRYVIRVPPTMRTCHQAVAWTAGYDNPDDYRPIVET